MLRLYASRLVLGKEKGEENLVRTLLWKRKHMKAGRSVMRDFWLENRRRRIQWIPLPWEWWEVYLFVLPHYPRIVRPECREVPVSSLRSQTTNYTSDPQTRHFCSKVLNHFPSGAGHWLLVACGKVGTLWPNCACLAGFVHLPWLVAATAWLQWDHSSVHSSVIE